MKKLISILLALTLFSTFVVATEVPELTAQQLLSMKNAAKTSDFIILDVRSPEEYAEQHIEGAINISHSTIADKLSALQQYKNTLVVVHCRSGRRAAIAEEVLMNNGFTQVKHLAGDMNGWLAADLPTISQE